MAKKDFICSTKVSVINAFEVKDVITIKSDIDNDKICHLIIQVLTNVRHAI